MFLWAKPTYSSPTRTLQNSSSCIDLIVTNQPNFVIKIGVHLYLHAICNHQMACSKLNLKIEHPPPYERLVWDYKNANLRVINKASEAFNWEESFQDKDTDGKACIINKAVISICHNYIPNKFNGRSMTKTYIG